jgi:hypothetical protein
MDRSQARVLALVALIAVAAASRLLPHPQNFTAIGAMALFAGATLADRRLAFLVPLAALFVSDLVIGLHGLLPLVYALFAVSVCMGFALRGRVATLPVAGAGIACAMLFYLVTNFAVWAGGALYPHTWEGLVACYVAALPFFQNSLLGNLFFSALLFGGLALAERGVPMLRQAAHH